MNRVAIFSAVSFACSLSCAAVIMPGQVFAQSGPQLKLDQLDRLSSSASEVVNVTLDESMLKAAGGFLAVPRQGADIPNGIQDVIAGLKGVYVRTFSFEKAGAYSADVVESLRLQLKAPWSRIVSTQDRRQNESVDVYMWKEAGQTGGLAVIVAEPKELTVVNIIGDIDLARLASLGGTLGLPLGVGPAAAPPPPPPVPPSPPPPAPRQ